MGNNIKKGICIINFPITKRGLKPVKQLVEIFKELNDQVFLISGSLESDFCLRKHLDIPVINIKHFKSITIIQRIVNHLLTQLFICIAILKIRNRVRHYFFFIGGELLLIPHILVKLLRAKSSLILAGFSSRGSSYMNDPLTSLDILLSRINFKLSNRIIVYSKLIVKERNLMQFNDKIRIAKHHYLKPSEINYVDINKKKEIIGFLGNLEPNKGIMNLLLSMKLIVNENKNFKLYIGGSGDKEYVNKLKKFVRDNNLSPNIIFCGWINRTEVPKFLAKVKYFVLPSLTEGLPNAIIEAMACGCCVITTPVGAIPDVITHMENGIITKSNDPDSIYSAILKTKNIDIKEISIKAYNTVLNRFTFDCCVNDFKHVIKDLG